MKRLLLVLLLALLLAVPLGWGMIAPSASAHSSTYCGHGHSGWHIITNDVTHYRTYYWERSWHYHVYRHFWMIDNIQHIYDHEQHKVCPGH